MAGFSSGSTITSSTAVRAELRNAAMTGRTSAGVAQRNPSAPHALAKATKSIGLRSQPNSGLPSSFSLPLNGAGEEVDESEGCAVVEAEP